jgi:hypothetical protein
MKIETVVANVSDETTMGDIEGCEPFVLAVTSYYPSGSGTDLYLHKGSTAYRTVDYRGLLKALQQPNKVQSTFKAYSGTLE